jgi:hypothetical protein
MRRCLYTIGGLLFLALLNGCFLHTSMLTLIPDQPMSSGLSDSEKAAALAAVGEVAQHFQLVPNPNLQFLQEHSEREDYYDYKILADYTRAGDQETQGSRIVLSVGIRKDTGRFAVLITDLDRSGETVFTRELEETLVTTLKARLPTYRVDVHRKRLGPLLPP